MRIIRLLYFQMFLALVLLLEWPTGNSLLAKGRSLQSSGTQNEVNLKIKSVGLDAPYANVLRRLGRPQKIRRVKNLDETCGDPSTIMTLYYPGLIVTLEGPLSGRNLRVVSFESTSSSWTVSPGIRMGIGERRVKAKLGTSAEEADESGLHKLYYEIKNGPGTAVLYFRAGRLVKVEWGYTLC